MARKKTSGPTDRELAILGVLWDKGPSTVRDVHEALKQEDETGYTTTLKLMQIMVDKGLRAVRCEQTARTQSTIYTTRPSTGRLGGTHAEATDRRPARPGLCRLGGEARPAGPVRQEGLAEGIEANPTNAR